MIVTFLNDKIKEDKTILLEPHSPHCLLVRFWTVKSYKTLLTNILTNW
jgi:hypothetical protein